MYKKRGVVLLSGGLDSSTVCALMASKGREIFALTIDYNQRHRIELESAKRIAKHYGAVEHIILPLDLTRFGGSSLTDREIKVQTNTPIEKIGNHIPNSYVPGRNMIFIALAIAFSETRSASEVWLGVNSVDYSGYPDCRKEFIDEFRRLSALATKVGVEGDPVQIVTPLLDMDKGEIIKTGLSLGVDYSETMTCYSPNERGEACGHCESCLLRLQGFKAAGQKDPAAYVKR